MQNENSFCCREPTRLGNDPPQCWDLCGGTFKHGPISVVSGFLHLPLARTYLKARKCQWRREANHQKGSAIQSQLRKAKICAQKVEITKQTQIPRATAFILRIPDTFLFRREPRGLQFPSDSRIAVDTWAMG